MKTEYSVPTTTFTPKELFSDKAPQGVYRCERHPQGRVVKVQGGLIGFFPDGDIQVLSKKQQCSTDCKYTIVREQIKTQFVSPN
ncbi:MAG: hypothetical protein QM813_09350 [Verrucomicrobiota bacterium]